MLVFYDDQYVSMLRDEDSRKIARHWQGSLGRTYGLYSSIPNHRCMDVCFDGDEEEDSRTNRVHCICRRLCLYGCPRSGLVHQCGDSDEARRYTCTSCSFVTQDGSQHCRYSSLRIHGPDMIFNPHTHDQFHLEVDETRTKSVQPFIPPKVHNRDDKVPRDQALTAMYTGKNLPFKGGSYEDISRSLEASIGPRTPQGNIDRIMKRLSGQKRPRAASSPSSTGNHVHHILKRAKKGETPSHKMLLVGDLSMHLDEYTHAKKIVSDLLFDRRISDILGEDYPWPMHEIYTYRRKIKSTQEAAQMIEEGRLMDSESMTGMYTEKMMYIAGKLDDAIRDKGGIKKADIAKKGIIRRKKNTLYLAALYILADGVRIDGQVQIPQDKLLNLALPNYDQLVMYGHERFNMKLVEEREVLKSRAKYTIDKKTVARMQNMFRGIVRKQTHIKEALLNMEPLYVNKNV